MNNTHISLYISINLITMRNLIFAILVLLSFNLFSQSCCFIENGNTGGADNTFGVCLGDLNANGNNDVVTVNAYDGFNVWFNDGTGLFINGVAYSAGSDFYGVELEDVDGDGDLDIIAMSFYSSQATEIWTNNGAGSFYLIDYLKI